MDTILKDGTFIKYKKRKYGIIDGRYSKPEKNCYYFHLHNGMKLTLSIGGIEDFEVIPKDKFLDFVKKNGHTSFYDLIK